MRLRWTLSLAFVVLGLVQVAAVVPLSLRSLSSLLDRQHQARVDQWMVAVEAERRRMGDDVGRALDELARSTAAEDAVHDAATVPPPASLAGAAAQLMAPRGLEVLVLLDDEGTTLSSGHLPARLGEPDPALFAVTRAMPGTVQATTVELSGPSGLVTARALVSARALDAGGRRAWVVGGVLLDERRARTLSALTGARVELVTGADASLPAGPGTGVTRTVPLGPGVAWRLEFPRDDLLAARREALRGLLGLAGVGLCLSVALGLLLSRRITRPVESLTEAAARIAEGTPGVTVEAPGATGELAALVATFNRMTADLKTATDRLVASERIAAWQEVAQRLAHEVKNPLTPIRMSLETLLAASQRGPLDERFKALFAESARAMLEEVERLKRIVDEFSRFARLPRPVLAPLDVGEAVASVMALFGPHDGLRYEVLAEPGLQALADRDQVTQVLVNLVKNAEEAMAGRCGAIRVAVRGEGPQVVVEVEDEGPGIPPQLRERLFEPWVTTKPQGTGLGLAIARRILHEHGGRLEAGEASTGGAHFRMVLPRPGER